MCWFGAPDKSVMLVELSFAGSDEQIDCRKKTDCRYRIQLIWINYLDGKNILSKTGEKTQVAKRTATWTRGSIKI